MSGLLQVLLKILSETSLSMATVDISGFFHFASIHWTLGWTNLMEKVSNKTHG